MEVIYVVRLICWPWRVEYSSKGFALFQHNGSWKKYCRQILLLQLLYGTWKRTGL